MDGGRAARRQRIDRPVDQGADIKVSIQGSVRIQARHIGGGHAVHVGKVAANGDLAIVADIHRLHRAIGAQPRREGVVHRAVHIQPGNMMAVRPVEGGEVTADDDLPVGLHGDRIDAAIGPAVGRGDEGSILIAIGQQAHEPPVRIRIKRSKAARHDGLAVRLFREGIDRAAVAIGAAAHAALRAGVEQEGRIGITKPILVPATVHRPGRLLAADAIIKQHRYRASVDQSQDATWIRRARRPGRRLVELHQ